MAQKRRLIKVDNDFYNFRKKYAEKNNIQMIAADKEFIRIVRNAKE